MHIESAPGRWSGKQAPLAHRRRRGGEGPGRPSAGFAISAMAMLVLSCGDGSVEPAPPPAPVATTVAGDRAERLEDRSRLLNGGWRCRIRLGFTPRHCRPSGGGSGSSGALRGLGLPPGREKGPRIERDPFQTDRARPAMSAAICRRRTISGLLSRVRDTVQEALARDS